MVKRKVIQYTRDMVPIRTWDSIKEAQETYHISHISGVCRKQRRTDGGFVWRYEDPTPVKPMEKRKRAEIAGRKRVAPNGAGKLPEPPNQPGTMSDLASRLGKGGR